MLLDQEAREEAEAAVHFHADAVAAALTERTALDGPWGWLARLWRTHSRDVAHCDTRIAHHHHQLQLAKKRLAALTPAAAEAPDPAETLDLDAVAAHLRRDDRVEAEQLRQLDATLKELDEQHALAAEIHRRGAAMVAAIRSRPSAAGGLRGVVAGWLMGSKGVQEARDRFAAACRVRDLAYQPSTDLESEADQAELILAGLQDEAIAHRRERRQIETERDALLRRTAPDYAEIQARETPLTKPSTET